MVRRSLTGISARGRHYDTPVHGCHLIVIGRLSVTLALLLVAACASAPPAGSLSTSISRYEEGNYARAYGESIALAKTTTGIDADRARVLAAMSAWRLGREKDAWDLAQLAAVSPDPSTRGQALVVVADVELARGRPETAAQALDGAATAFEAARAPQDAASARRFAQRARLSAPPPTPVAPPPTRAAAETPKPAAAQPTPTPRAPVRQFTIRAGSYTTLAAAQKRLKAIAVDVARANAGDARVAEVTTVSGERLYAVRIGAWPTRAEAEKSMRTIARKDLMVGAFDDGK